MGVLFAQVSELENRSWERRKVWLMFDLILHATRKHTNSVFVSAKIIVDYKLKVLLVDLV